MTDTAVGMEMRGVRMVGMGTDICPHAALYVGLQLEHLQTCCRTHNI